MSSDVIRTLKWVFGKGGLIEEYKRQEQMLEETPKSVASMTRIFAPQISRDFPGMNLEQFEALAQQQLVAALQAGNSRPKQQPPHFPASLQKKICPCNSKEIHEKILDQKYVCIKYIYFLSPRFFSDMPPIIRCRRLLFCQKSAL